VRVAFAFFSLDVPKYCGERWTENTSFGVQPSALLTKGGKNCQKIWRK